MSKRSQRRKATPDVVSRVHQKRSPSFVLLIAALAVATSLAYQPAWHGGMLWDDDRHLTRPDLQSLQGLSRIWTEVETTPQYYPVVHTVFWLLHRVAGSDTLVYHLTNISLHV